MSQLQQPLTGESQESSCADPEGFPRKVLSPCGASLGVAVLISYCLAVLAWWWVWHGGHSQLPSYKYALPWEVLAVTMAVFASAISFHHMWQHIQYNQNDGKTKTHVLIILSMVPVYAICSGVSLIGTMDTNYIAIPLTAFREFYEALVLVAFLQFIAEFWGGTVQLAGMLDTDPLVMSTVFPTPVEFVNDKFRCILRRIETYPNALLDLRAFPFPRIPGSHYVAWTYVGALQYAVVMWFYIAVILSLWVLVLLGLLQHHTVEKVDMGFKVIKGASNLIAMYNLLILFEYLREGQNTHERMNKIRPISKFVCIKLIVLFSLWQEALFSGAAKLHLLLVMRGYNVEWSSQQKMARAVVNFLVCVEMLLFAWWHRYAYPYKEVWDLNTDDLPRKMKRIAAEKAKIHQPSNIVLRHSVFKMTDDVGYLLFNRVRGQFRVVKLLKAAKKSGNLDNMLKQKIEENFKYFDLDLDKGASVTQLQHVLCKTQFADNWEDAKLMLKRADTDNSNRLSIDELWNLLPAATQNPAVAFRTDANR